MKTEKDPEAPAEYSPRITQAALVAANEWKALEKAMQEPPKTACALALELFLKKLR
jgi:hypothetical protein